MDHLFPVTRKIIHLNHAGVGPWPIVTADAVNAFAQENCNSGSLNYLRWMEKENYLRHNLANLINAKSADEIAFIKNTSEGLSLVAYGLPWNKGDNVVGIQQEFSSNRFVWESLSSQGVEFRKLDLSRHDDPEQALMSLCDKHTKLISISAVQYADGFRLDLKKIGQFCRENKILFCVDAIQQIGSLGFNVREIKADFAIADGHKWMLAAEGLGLMYVRKKVIKRLKVLQYGWHMTENMGDYASQDYQIVDSARRFECGSPNMLGIHALSASIDLLLNAGMHTIEAQVLDNSRFLIDGLNRLNRVKVLSNQSAERMSGIVTFTSDTMAADSLYRKLSEKKILCASRGGGVRFSPHFYTPREQLSHALSIVEDLTRPG